MSDRTIVDLIEDWQTGAFLLIGSAVVGFLTGGLVGTFADPPFAVLGVFAGAILAFLAFSYLLYGR